MRRGIILLVVILGSHCCSDWASAQTDWGAYGRRGTSRAFTQKYLSSRPTVSPYLNLVRDQSMNTGAPNYQTLVRPALDRRELARDQERQLSSLQNQVGTIQGDLRRAQSGAMATGHPTRFMTYSHFYPGLNR